MSESQKAYTKQLKFEDYERILVEGDSLGERNKTRWPFLRMMNWDMSWADELEEAIFCWRPDAKVTIQNNAVGGSTIKALTSRLPALEEFKPDIVFFTLGTNDPNFEISVEEFTTLLKAYVANVNALGAKVVIMGGMVECPNFDRGDEETTCFDKSAPYFAAMQEVGESTGNYYINMGIDMKKAADALYEKCPLHTIYSDGVHLNQVGARIVAGTVLRMFGILN